MHHVAHAGDLRHARAHWLARDTIAWNVEGGAANSYTLHADPDVTRHGAINAQTYPLAYDSTGLSSDLKLRFPQLATYGALKLPALDLDTIRALVKDQLVVAATDSGGNRVDATALQLPGVLDDLFAYNGQLGVSFEQRRNRHRAPTLKLWAPTARSVTLHGFDDSNPATRSTTYPMIEDRQTGVWSIVGEPEWIGTYYLYEVEVFVRATGRIERNLVTDPYALSLAVNSARSQIVDLDARELKPAGWDRLRKPDLAAPNDIVLYELHVRDFSSSDPSVPDQLRGTFRAFTVPDSAGMRHLRALAAAGLTHVHLLPAFDFASVNENPAQRHDPDPAELAAFPPDSSRQAEAVEALRDVDSFNWGYDPYHYTTPEGSYATNPDGPARIVEFREMVKALSQIGLRVVMDVVYNHTFAGGQDAQSVLDRIVPGYYHRLNNDGNIETSTCCANTATEHAMMEKLMIDSVLTWATAYKVDGFRFDLMGHHLKANMVKLRRALDALTLDKHGVDGRAIYLYGEGWSFGEVANNARGVNAAQLNMAGTGIGTFSDRLRDAVRGGGAFSGIREQGFVTGLLTDPNDSHQGSYDDQRARLLYYSDLIRVGLAGNLASVPFVDRNGALITGAELLYGGQPAGYALAPHETISYIEAHDNETLWDTIQLKASSRATLADRVRMQNLGASLVLLGQGIPFFQAGQDLLRSKSLDRNSYNSGDWFNKLDWSYESNSFGVGLPPGENRRNWPIMQPILANRAFKPGKPEILQAAAHFREMLRIRTSSPLFRLRSAAAITARVRFLNIGPQQIAGLIVMTIADHADDDLDPALDLIVALFNAAPEIVTFSDDALRNLSLRLHPVQTNGYDSVVKTARYDPANGAFTIPARTTAVFVAPQEGGLAR